MGSGKLSWVPENIAHFKENYSSDRIITFVEFKVKKKCGAHVFIGFKMFFQYELHQAWTPEKWSRLRYQFKWNCSETILIGKGKVLLLFLVAEEARR